MYSYIVGKVISINKKSITLENNYIGYVINVNGLNNFVKNKIIKIWLYKYVNITNKNSLNEEFYGFKSWDEKQFFMNCLSISGIGPKTAMNILQNDILVLKKLISQKDINAMEKLPGITKKNACLLVDYLANFYHDDKNANYDNVSDVINILKTLGYNQKDINFAINKLIETNQFDTNQDTSDVVSSAIKIISLKNETSLPKA